MAFDQKVVAVDVPLSKLAYGASSDRFMAMRIWTHQLADIQECRSDLDAVYVKCMSNLEPVAVVEVGAGSGLHTTGLLVSCPSIEQYAAYEALKASQVMLKHNVTKARAYILPKVKVVSPNKAIVHSPESVAHVTTINTLNSLKVKSSEAEVFVTELNQIGDTGPQDSAASPALYKTVTTASIDSELAFLHKHGFNISQSKVPGFRILKVSANTTTRRVFYGMEETVSMMRENGTLSQLVVTVETRSKWEHKDAVANMSVYGFQEVAELALPLPDGYTAHVFTKRSAAALVTDLWCK